jgi:hypothetical protein
VNQYLKFAAQVVATVLVSVVAALSDNVINTSETFNCITVGLGAIAVLGAGNFSAGVWSYMKGYVSAATTAAVFLTSAISGGMQTTEWIQLGIAILGTAGVIGLNGPTVQPARPVAAARDY